MSEKRRAILGIIFKILSVSLSVYGLIKSYSGPMVFTYFTVLSNIFIDIMLLIFLYKDIYYLIKKKKIKYKRSLYVTKFSATVSITLTFLVFNTILAPFFPGGFFKAYFENGGYSSCLHVIGPLLAILDFLLLDKDYKLKYSDDIYTLVPPFIYVIYVVILSENGVRWSDMKAPYNFLNYGAKVGWFGFDLSQMGWESLGIGVFYMIVIVSIGILLFGRMFLWARKKNG